MSIRQPDIPPLYDPRLDNASNGLINYAEQIRQQLQFSPPLINTKIMLLSAMTDETLQLILSPHLPHFPTIERQANSHDWYFGSYQNTDWSEESGWDQHVDFSMERAFRQAHLHGIPHASPALLVEQLLVSDPIADIIANRADLESLAKERAKRAQLPFKPKSRIPGQGRTFKFS